MHMGLSPSFPAGSCKGCSTLSCRFTQILLRFTYNGGLLTLLITTMDAEKKSSRKKWLVAILSIFGVLVVLVAILFIWGFYYGGFLPNMRY
jgi:hypothetical protein